MVWFDFRLHELDACIGNWNLDVAEPSMAKRVRKVSLRD